MNTTEITTTNETAAASEAPAPKKTSTTEAFGRKKAMTKAAASPAKTQRARQAEELPAKLRYSRCTAPIVMFQRFQR